MIAGPKRCRQDNVRTRVSASSGTLVPVRAPHCARRKPTDQQTLGFAAHGIYACSAPPDPRHVFGHGCHPLSKIRWPPAWAGGISARSRSSGKSIPLSPNDVSLPAAGLRSCPAQKHSPSPLVRASARGYVSYSRTETGPLPPTIDRFSSSPYFLIHRRLGGAILVPQILWLPLHSPHRRGTFSSPYSLSFSS